MGDKNIFVIRGGPWHLTGVYANEVTHGGPLDNFRMGTGHARKTNHVIRELEL